MSLLQSGKANVVIGGQFGSEGKGKTYGWIYEHEQVDVSICDFSPNAGHTCWLPNGTKAVSKVIPLGAWYGKKCLIGPHAVFDVNRFHDEVDNSILHVSEFTKILVNPNVSILSEWDAERERAFYSGISSTMQGSCEAQIHKMRRNPNGDSLARHKLNEIFIGDTFDVANTALDNGETLLIETAQGFDLGLNHGFFPYVTSRDCLVGRVLDNAGVSPRRLGNVIGVIRTFPIRVGNVEGGWSGPCYNDQKEITWDEVSKIRGVETIERTTVTNRVRRVFTFSFMQLTRFMNIVRPTHLVINFADYLPKPTLDSFLEQVINTAGMYDCQLFMLGTGPKGEDFMLCE